MGNKEILMHTVTLPGLNGPTPFEYVIGYRGGTEYRIESRKLMKIILQKRLDLQPENYKTILKEVIRESQYVDFEEVKPQLQNDKL